MNTMVWAEIIHWFLFFSCSFFLSFRISSLFYGYCALVTKFPFKTYTQRKRGKKPLHKEGENLAIECVNKKK